MLDVFSKKRQKVLHMDKLLIHQIAPTNTSDWHPFWSKCHDSWKKHYEVMVWNDQEDIDNLIRDYYPKWWNLYQAFPFHVMKIDFVRLAILHRYGGLYADMDIFCYKQIPEQYLNKPFVAIENLTEEYTSARFENSMMYSEKNNELMILLMDYVKTLFINSRHHFETPYQRSVKNDYLINNITGSGMLSAGMISFRQSGKFPCALFNNRPASYDPSFYTKHAHSSIWGKEYINKNKCNDLLILEGMMYQVDSVSEKLKDLIKDEPHYIMPIKDFDFKVDYTDGIYLKEDTNISEIKNDIRNTMEKINEYFRQSNNT